MYHTIVKQQVAKTFEQFNRGDFVSMQQKMANRLEVHSIFRTAHALGGSRHTKTAAARWYGRLVKIFPHIHFDVTIIQVKGWPWHTEIVAQWRDTLKLAGDKTVQNQGFHKITMRWFKITGVYMETNEEIAATAIAHQAQHGIPEAQEPPILDK
jgi:hypothetical protein